MTSNEEFQGLRREECKVHTKDAQQSTGKQSNSKCQRESTSVNTDHIKNTQQMSSSIYIKKTRTNLSIFLIVYLENKKELKKERKEQKELERRKK